MVNKKYIHIGIFAAFAFLLVSCTYSYQNKVMADATNLTMVGQYSLASEKHLVQDYPPIDTDLNINVVVEIPAGTNAKWEVDKTSGNLKWDFKKGKPMTGRRSRREEANTARRNGSVPAQTNRRSPGTHHMRGAPQCFNPTASSPTAKA